MSGIIINSGETGIVANSNTGGGGGISSLKELYQQEWFIDASQLIGGENQEKINNVFLTLIKQIQNAGSFDEFFYKSGYPTYQDLADAVPSPDFGDMAIIRSPKSIYICDIQGQWTLYTASIETINQLFADLKDGVPVEGDTLSKLYNLILDRYTKNETDALLDAKQNKIYDILDTKANILLITNISNVGKFAFATDTREEFKGVDNAGFLTWVLIQDNLKQNIADSSLETENKTIVGAINEIRQSKTFAFESLSVILINHNLGYYPCNIQVVLGEYIDPMGQTENNIVLHNVKISHLNVNSFRVQLSGARTGFIVYK